MALTDNLQFYYKLDGNSNDSLGTYNGTGANITYSAGNGKIIQGAGFNGTSSFIDTNAPGSIINSTNFTFSCWINTSITTEFDSMLLAVQPSSGNAIVYVQALSGGSNNFVDIYTRNDANNTVVINGVKIVNDGAWHSVIVVKSGATFSLYIDNVADGSAANSGAFTFNAQTIKLGRHPSANGNWWNGAMDEVGLWSRALTGAEITTLYNGGSGLQYPFITNTGNFLMFV